MTSSAQRDRDSRHGPSLSASLRQTMQTEITARLAHRTASRRPQSRARSPRSGAAEHERLLAERFPAAPQQRRRRAPSARRASHCPSSRERIEVALAQPQAARRAHAEAVGPAPLQPPLAGGLLVVDDALRLVAAPGRRPAARR